MSCETRATQLSAAGRLGYGNWALGAPSGERPSAVPQTRHGVTMGAAQAAWSKGYILTFFNVHKNLQNACTSSLPFLTVYPNSFKPYNEKL